jgi:hypothetical protein
MRRIASGRFGRSASFFATRRRGRGRAPGGDTPISVFTSFALGGDFMLSRARQAAAPAWSIPSGCLITPVIIATVLQFFQPQCARETRADYPHRSIAARASFLSRRRMRNSKNFPFRGAPPIFFTMLRACEPLGSEMTPAFRTSCDPFHRALDNRSGHVVRPLHVRDVLQRVVVGRPSP